MRHYCPLSPLPSLPVFWYTFAAQTLAVMPRAETSLTKAEQSQKTRRALLDTARAIFTTQGYAATATEEIVRRAGVTRGALYYQFRDKPTLFEAVFDEVRGEHIQALRAAMATAEGDAWQRLMTWVALALEGSLDPSVRRIVYLDGPVVLDWSSERRRAPAIALLRDIFEPLMAEGVIERLPLDALARQLWALFFQAVVDIAQAEEGALALHERLVVLRRILRGLQPAGS